MDHFVISLSGKEYIPSEALTAAQLLAYWKINSGPLSTTSVLSFSAAVHDTHHQQFHPMRTHEL